MLDRGFSEVELREMLERATAYRPDAAAGRFVIETAHDERPWEVIIEPDDAARQLIVVTAYALTG